MSDRPTILIIDDDPGLARSLQILIEEERKYRVVLVNCFDDSERLLEERSDIKLVVSDLIVDGRSLVDHILGLRRRNISTPFVCISAYADWTLRGPLHRLGIRYWSPKPIDPDQLLGIVDEACRAP